MTLHLQFAMLLLATLAGAFGASPPAQAAGNTVEIDIGRGPVTVHLPAAYDGSEATPLVVLLHGYGGTGAGQEAYMQFLPRIDDYGFLYAYPDGAADFFGVQFWEATDACDSFPDVDDSTYLRTLIDEIAAQLNVDGQRIYLIGHSNGGCMSFRMACEHSDRIAAIASLAGSTWLDPLRCSPAQPVHVLEIHGTNDPISLFQGGCLGDTCYPGAIDTVRPWVAWNACEAGVSVDNPRLDLVANLPGPETAVVKAGRNCSADGSVELWVMRNGPHSPVFSGAFTGHVLDYLFSKQKPSAAQ